MHPQLDLNLSIRPGLDILANEIIIALKKRSRFPCNRAVYTQGLVLGQPDTILLHHELGRVETIHAELGRYIFASQESFTDVSNVAPIIVRSAPDSPIEKMPSGMSEQVIEFYLSQLPTYCREGTDELSYGETVTADVNALLCILERINLGKFVAESKMADAPEAFKATRGEREPILALIVKKDREGEVFALAERLADHYDLDPAWARAVFEWMVAATIEIEVDYVRMRLGI